MPTDIGEVTFATRQHVVKARRPAQVVDQEVRAGADGRERADPAGAAQRGTAGELPARREQRGAGSRDRR
ncbi:hypothetical protein [Micromonospora sp. b486]|uniref:hypothetical protein n=1 Tax=Micromonospora sp. b486 TaxID=3053986 RepID=UPI00338F72A4